MIAAQKFPFGLIEILSMNPIQNKIKKIKENKINKIKKIKEK